MRRDADDLTRFQREAHLWVPHHLTIDHYRLATATGRPVDVYPPGFEFLSQRASGSEMRRVLGHDGSPVVGGRVELFDHNRKLDAETWRGSFGQLGRVDEMRRSDPVVGAIWTAFETYISSAPWPDVKPQGTDRTAFEMARFLRAALFEHSATPWRSYLRQAGVFPLTGTALAEVTWRVDKAMGASYGLDYPMVTIADVKPRRLNTVARWLRLEDRATTATRWLAEQWPDESDPDVGEQRVSRAGETLHPDKLIHLRWSFDGEAPEGVGMLRSTHASWALRQTLRKALSVGADRSSTGVPFFRVQPGYGRENDAALRTMLNEYRSGARSNLGVIPDGVEIGFADLPFKGEMVDKAIKSEGMAIARGCSMPWLFTGVDNGTEALMRSQMLTTKAQLRTAMQAIVDAWCYGPHAHANRLIRANWGSVPLEEIPSLEAPDVHLGDPMQLVELFAAAIAAGTLTPDAGLEAQIRQAAGASEMPDETMAAWEHRLLNSVPIEVVESETPDEDVEDGDEEAEQSSDQGDEVVEGAVDVDDGADDAVAQGEELRETCEHAPRASLALRSGELTSGPRGRELRPIERCVRLRETSDATQGGREEIAQLVERWRVDVAPRVAERMVEGDVVSVATARKVDVPGAGALAAQIEDVLRAAYRAGGEAVEAELDRQARDPALAKSIADGVVERGEFGEMPSERAGEAPLSGLLRRVDGWRVSETLARRRAAKPKTVAAGKSVADEIDPEKAIRAVAGSTVDAVVSRIREEGLRVLQASSIGGFVVDEQRDAVRSTVAKAIGDLSVGKDLVQAQRDVNTMFGLGRIQTARGLDDVSPTAIFSNLLESETCDSCAAADGRRVQPDELDEFATPYSECHGGDLCNCLLIFSIR